MTTDSAIPSLLLGCDFSSSPSRRKPIVLALGQRVAARVQLLGLETFDTLDGLARWLAAPRAWVGGFDLPFGLPRELVQALGWPLQWHACMQHYRALSREQIRDAFAAFCAARPVGGKFAHRATDGPAGSSPSMKWVNPPVAYMLHAGVPLLLDAGVHLPGLHPGDPQRVALEAYPGLLAREILARRSYKSDDRAKQTPDRLIARKDLVHALEMGQSRLGAAAPRGGRCAVWAAARIGWSGRLDCHGLRHDPDRCPGTCAPVMRPQLCPPDMRPGHAPHRAVLPWHLSPTPHVLFTP